MGGKMKILIGYDGSECADAALEDLRRAGLPAEAEAFVLSVADVMLPPPFDEVADEALPLHLALGIRRAHERAAQAVERASGLAEYAAGRIRTSFPGWDVRAEAWASSPAWAVVMKADAWKPDLVVVGAHGHTVLGGRLILGSVSQRVLYEARCSVRVARNSHRPDGSPVRVLVGTDNSPDAAAAVDAVAARAWPEGTEVRLVAVLDTVLPVSRDEGGVHVLRWVEVGEEEEWGWVKDIFEASAERLRAKGLDTTVVLKKGNPKHALVEEAESWGADSIFVGARGARGIDRLLLGSVSAAAAARAHCSVEVVRPPEKPPEAAA